MSLARDKALNAVQAMPFTEGLIGITSGTTKNVSLIQCTAAGEIVLTFPSGGTKTVTMTEDSNRSLTFGCSVTVNSGTFDFD